MVKFGVHAVEGDKPSSSVRLPAPKSPRREDVEGRRVER